MKKIASIFCLIAVLFSIGCAKKIEKVEGGEISSNGGIAVAQGDWIYFVNGAMPELTPDALNATTNRAKIFRMHKNGSSITAVSTKKAFRIFLFEDKIFYTTPNSSRVDIYCMNIDGTENKRLFTSDDGQYVEFGISGVAIAQDKKIFYFDYKTQTEKSFETGDVSGIITSENYIYYYNESVIGTKRINISSGSIEKVCDHVGQFLYADDETIYLSYIRVPIKVNTNTLEVTEISTALYKNMLFNLANRCIVAVPSSTEDTGLYFQPIDNVAGEETNKKRIKIHQKEISAYCLSDEYVFFVEAETNNIYRMTYKGTEKTVLGTISTIYDVDSIDAAGNMLYIFDDGKSGLCYYVPIDGSGKLTVAAK